MVPKHEDIFYVMAWWHVYWAFKYQLLSSIIIDLVDVMKVNIFLLSLFCSCIRLETTGVASCGIINIRFLWLKSWNRKNTLQYIFRNSFTAASTISYMSWIIFLFPFSLGILTFRKLMMLLHPYDILPIIHFFKMSR